MHYAQKLRCSRCGKGLWKKYARLIGGKVLCNPCMFGQPPKRANDTLQVGSKEE